MWIFIPGKPKGKQRPRVCKGHAFTPQETKDYELMIANLYKALHGQMLEGYVKVEIIAKYAIPKKYTKKQREAVRRGEIRPAVKPDIDNIIKIILDGLNGIAYKDDAQVIEVRARKTYTMDDEGVMFNVDKYVDWRTFDKE